MALWIAEDNTVNVAGTGTVFVMTSRFDTLAVHAARDDFTALGVHAPPLDLSTTYPVPDLDAATRDLDLLAGGAREPESSPIYARLHNPTVDRFERAMALLEGADECVAFASGMAAMTAVLLAVARGRHVVGVRPLYGGTDHLLESRLLGVDVTWVRPEEVGSALRPDTALVIVETPANPTCELVDIRAMVHAAGPVPLLVDSTFATPVLQRPLGLGAALVLHSATKCIGGHGDVMAGVVATSAGWAAELRRVRIATGGILHPLAAYLLHRGLQTLPLRVRRAQSSATELSLRLLSHPAVARVRYPGLPGGDPDGLIGTQMDGPGSMMAFEVHGGYDAAAMIMRSVRLITPAVSLGSADTLIQHPAGLTHRVLSSDARTSGGVTPGLLRLSVGLEDVEDLWHDLQVALDAALPVAVGAEEAIG